MVLLLALGIGLAAAPAAIATDRADRACYTDGVVHSCEPPVAVYLGTGSSAGVFAGPTVPNPVGPYVEFRYENY